MTGYVTIPMTPGPCQKNMLFENARDRFIGVIWVTCDDDEKYLKQFDYAEPYSEEKSYSKRPYLATYKNRMREYQNYLCVCSNEDGEKYYVIAKALPSELEELEPYCPCSTCQAFVWNPMKYLWCPYCTSCLKAGPGFAKEEYIEEARQRRQKELKMETNKWHKMLANCNKTKVCEYAIISIPVLMGLWYYF